jgi:hypothetical protein
LTAKGTIESDIDPSSSGTQWLIFLIPVIGVFVVGGLLLDLFLLKTFPGFTGATGAEVALAIGTGALAYAAALQAAATIDSVRLDNAWRTQRREDRKKDREPHLRVMRKKRFVTKHAEPVNPLISPTTFQFEQRYLVLGNLGPGIAANIQGLRTEAWQTLEAVIAAKDAAEDSTDDTPDTWDDLDVSESAPDIGVSYLGPNEEVELACPDEWIKPPDPTYGHSVLIFFRFTCTDLDNRQADSAEGGLQFTPALNQSKGNLPGEIKADQEFRRRHSPWTFVSNLEESAIGRKTRNRRI